MFWLAAFAFALQIRDGFPAKNDDSDCRNPKECQDAIDHTYTCVRGNIIYVDTFSPYKTEFALLQLLICTL